MILVKVAQDAVDHAGHGDDGDDLHLRAAVTKQRVGLVDAADELRPRTSRGAPVGW
jgi:hypothetical protein